MYSSAELIDALRRRAQQPAGEFPSGWAAWFAQMRERVGTVTGATAAAILAIMLDREPAAPPRAVLALNRWQSFSTLWRQQWHPESRDSRATRVVGIVVSLLLHLLFAVFLVYLAYVRLMAVSTDAPEGEDVIQVQYIGDGTPQDTGGGPAQAATVAPPAGAPR
ncbi:MAG: hypothetical protein ACREO8_11185, partial [Luteimonas sp.]